MPCSDACNGLEGPDADCLECMNDNGYFGGIENPIRSAPMLLKKAHSFMKKEGGKDDFECMNECDETV